MRGDSTITIMFVIQSRGPGTHGPGHRPRTETFRRSLTREKHEPHLDEEREEGLRPLFIPQRGPLRLPRVPEKPTPVERAALKRLLATRETGTGRSAGSATICVRGRGVGRDLGASSRLRWTGPHSGHTMSSEMSDPAGSEAP